MRRTKMATIMITLSVLAVARFDALPGQESGKSLLEKVERTYKNLDSYQFEGTISSQIESASGEISIDASFVMAAIKPDKVRVEIKSPAMGLEYFSIASGKTTWEYLPRQGQYTRKESKEAFGEKELYFRMWALALGVMLPSFERITERLKNAEIVREESISVSGSKNCYVVEAEYDSPDYGHGGGTSHKTFWIDRDRYAVLKEITTDTMKLGALRGAETRYVTTFAVVKLNEPLDDSLFIFTPQDGAKEVKQFDRPQKTKAK
ncbi:MAG: LolA family protein [Thermodesulfobacteriota bacterium]